MNDVTPVTRKVNPPALNRRGVNGKGPKHITPCEMERKLASQDKSPPKKKKSPLKSSSSESPESFEATAAGASKEVSMLFSKYAEALSERAAADTSQMKELEQILVEARNLESHLKEKKTLLRRTLDRISEKLQG